MSLLLKTAPVLAFSFSCLLASTQSFNNINASFINGELSISYDLLGDKVEGGYLVEVRSSFDNFLTALPQVSGDIGRGVQPGTNLRVNWNPATSLPEGFNNQIQFKLVGNPLGKPTRSIAVGKTFKTPTDGGKVKRGKNSAITWQGMGSGDYQLRLYRYDLKVQDISGVKGSASYDWTVPSDMETGDGYELRLESSNESIRSGAFSITNKIPLGVKLVPLLAVGGAAAALGGGGENNGNGGTTDSGVLPGPPDPD